MESVNSLILPEKFNYPDLYSGPSIISEIKDKLSKIRDDQLTIFTQKATEFARTRGFETWQEVIDDDVIDTVLQIFLNRINRIAEEALEENLETSIPPSIKATSFPPYPIHLSRLEQLPQIFRDSIRPEGVGGAGAPPIIEEIAKSIESMSEKKWLNSLKIAQKEFDALFEVSSKEPSNNLAWVSKFNSHRLTHIDIIIKAFIHPNLI